jgi:hypothetical protein
MPVKITLYKYLGKWGPFRIKEACEECDIASGILKDMMKNEFKGRAVTYEEKPWLNNWIYCLLRGAWHAPIVMVNGRRFHQFSEKDPIFNREKLKEHVLMKL